MPTNTPTRSKRLRRTAVVALAAATAALIPVTSASAATSIASLVAATRSGQMLNLSSGTYTFSNFGTNHIGVDLRGKAGMRGAGSSSTIVEMTPYSSTRASLVPSAPGTGNPLNLMAVSGTPTLAGFSLQGTPQGHNYNGLVLQQTTNARINDVKVLAIPGSGYNPPQETFAINDIHTSYSNYVNVVVDGQGVGASGLAANSSSNISISSSTFTNNRYSAGVALWQTHNATLSGVRTTNNRTGLNFERCSGQITITRPTILNESNQDFYIGSDQASTKITIVDPVYSGHLRIRVPATYRGVQNKQLRSDIRVIVNGVDRTSAVVTWL